MSNYHGTLGTYIAGFVGSLLCTFLAYYLVVAHAATPAFILGAVVALALFQFGLQVVLFLHLGRTGKRWDATAFAFAFVIVCIVVVGSLWIMRSLNAHMMPSTGTMVQYMQSQDSM